MNELALFAGAGGGILAGTLLGWRTVCAVERDVYCAAILAQRQNDGCLPAFPVWSDVTTFDGRPWRGIVDVVSGGFPCQDISIAGHGDGLEGGVSQDYGAKWCVSFAKLDRNMSTWKTPQRSLLGNYTEYLETWPNSGLMHDGECWELPMWAPLTFEKEYGLWPTPTVKGNYNKKGLNEKSGDGLATAVFKCPTPAASDWKGSTKAGQRRGQLTDPAMNIIPAGGALNPTWVEWLMGWPIGWTDLKPLAMDKFQEWLKQHGD